MLKVITASVCIFIIAILMSMVGRGGGNFYVPVLIAAGSSMNQAATSAQLILLTTAIVATLVFHKHRTVDWKLALVIDPPTDVMAFVGGYFAHCFTGYHLKFLFAGMVGISGGSFKIPLMVLACGVPMKIAIGTSSAMVAVTALMGFAGHTIAGDFNFMRTVPMVCAAVIGGVSGSKISIKTNPDRLKKFFAYTTLAAALFMVFSAYKGG